jgi:hypothetical protein
MNLSGTQLKDTYGNLVTTGTTAGSPTTGGLQNGDGQLLTQVGIGTNSFVANTPLTLQAPSGYTDTLWLKSVGTNIDSRINIGPTGTGNAQINNATGTNIEFQVSGSEKMRIQSSGAIGINNSSPDSFATSVSTSSSLVIGQGASGVSPGLTLWQGNSAQATINFASANTGAGQYEGRIRYTRDTGVMDFRTNGLDNVLVLNSSGNVGIGETNPLVPIHISKDSASGENIALLLDNNNTTANNEVGLLFRGSVGGQNTDFQIASINKSANNADLVFRSDGTVERMRILSGGDVSFAMEDFSASPSNTVYGLRLITGTTGKSYWKSAVNADTTHYHYEFLNTNGSVGNISTSASATAYNTSSDYRLKENVVALTGALDRVDQLNPSRFNFIADADTTVDGFLAHEVADVVPEAITGEKDAVDDEGNPIYQGIDQSKLVPLLVGAIQELRAEIEQLKNQ